MQSRPASPLPLFSDTPRGARVQFRAGGETATGTLLGGNWIREPTSGVGVLVETDENSHGYNPTLLIHRHAAGSFNGVTCYVEEVTVSDDGDIAEESWRAVGHVNELQVVETDDAS